MTYPWEVGTLDELAAAIRSDVDRIESLLHNPEPLEMTT